MPNSSMRGCTQSSFFSMLTPFSRRRRASFRRNRARQTARRCSSLKSALTASFCSQPISKSEPSAVIQVFGRFPADSAVKIQSVLAAEERQIRLKQHLGHQPLHLFTGNIRRVRNNHINIFALQRRKTVAFDKFHIGGCVRRFPLRCQAPRRSYPPPSPAHLFPA